MAMNMQPGATPPVDPAFTKLADTAEQALAGMFKMCHQVSPDSPLCEALVDMQKAVAEIESQYAQGPMEQPTDATAEPMPDEAAMLEEDAGQMPPTDMQPEAEVAAQPSGNPMFDAAAALQAETVADAKKRKPTY